MLQDIESIPADIVVSLSEKKIGFRLDNADLVFVPLRKYSYRYIVVANFRDGRFEVICPFKDIAIIQSDAFNIFGSVSNQTNHNDSGVFVLQLLLAYDGKTHFHFKEEHAKPLRESITYYLCTHEENELIMPEIKDIARQHGIEVQNYKARGKSTSRK
ncbi:uncharacterized protein LOC120712749 isoform X2 [Panicum virgatum]|uniref:uncharacterized protein LOC120712749 isoform X2 n=1 Tax=Panicum virgatum TaxID=38727 RepID=UPI0019D5B6AE|nr:uncharacterized protein LOC120712749 isoform X2 [Panicum virgatum]